MSGIPMLDPDMSGTLFVDNQKQHKVNNDKESEEEFDMLDSSITLDKSATDFVEKWSQHISSKLLMGWMLLDEVCVRAEGGCYGDLPLVKDLAGQVSYKLSLM
jgi:hypothetical protein